MRSLLTALLLMITMATAHAGKYDYFECTGAHEILRFSIVKCEKGEKQKRILNDEPPPETIPYTPPQVPSASAGNHQPQASSGVILYATSWCGYCRLTRAFLAENRIQYFEYDIEKSEEGRRQRDALGGQGVPVLNVRGTIIHGYSREAILNALK